MASTSGRHRTIPVFIPEEACPNRCVFCNQYNIAGAAGAPAPARVRATIDAHLATMPAGSEVGIGFFGGNFTGIPAPLQRSYLQIAREYADAGLISNIRLSTRPDYISVAALELLKEFGVTAIELGAQSLDDEVLTLAGRGHTAAQVAEASALIRAAGFELGLQMMIGLPGDTPEKSMHTANEIIRLGAKTTRIYPTLVIMDTLLEKWFRSGMYHPLTLEEAVSRTADLLPLFYRAGVHVLRIGLHPSDGLTDGSNLVAGPFHVAFGEMAFAETWRRIFMPLAGVEKPGASVTLEVPAGQRNAAVGHRAANRRWLEQYYKQVRFGESCQLKPFEYHAVYH